MYVFTKRDSKTNRILTVETLGTYKGKTEAEMIEATDKFNANHEYTFYDSINIEDERIAEVFRFLLGGSCYKTTKEIEDLVDEMRNLKSMLDEIDDEVLDMRSRIQDVIKQTTTFMNNIKEEQI